MSMKKWIIGLFEPSSKDVQNELINEFCKNCSENDTSGGNESDTMANACYGCDNLHKYEMSKLYNLRCFIHYAIEEIKDKVMTWFDEIGFITDDKK